MQIPVVDCSRRANSRLTIFRTKSCTRRVCRLARAISCIRCLSSFRSVMAIAQLSRSNDELLSAKLHGLQLTESGRRLGYGYSPSYFTEYAGFLKSALPSRPNSVFLLVKPFPGGTSRSASRNLRRRSQTVVDIQN